MAKSPRRGTPEDDWEQNEAAPSKSQLKREMDALQALGKQIIELSPAMRAKLPLSDDMHSAIAEMERIKAHEARRRHMQYVGKVMRNEDIEGINAAFRAIEDQRNARDRAFHQLEQLRDRLIDNGDDMLDEILPKFPGIDIGQLRQLIRNAKRERDGDKAPTNARKLFKLLREHSDM